MTQESTFQGIHVWMKNMFEKLGWILLAKRNGHTKYVEAYADALVRLSDVIANKLKWCEGKEIAPDVVQDLKIIQIHVNHLKAIVKKSGIVMRKPLPRKVR